VKKMRATATPRRRLAKPVRLHLSDGDYERLGRVAEERALNTSSYARRVVLALIQQDEEARGK
jgi:hypothetical protein